MRRQRHMKLCREGWVYLGILAFVLMGAMMRQINLLIVLYGLLVGPLLINWRYVRQMLAKIEVRRRFPATVTAGEPLKIVLEATNHRWRLGSWVISVRDTLKRIGSSEPALEPKVLFPYVPAGKTRRTDYTVRLSRRGRYRLGPLYASSRFPFGLILYGTTLPCQDEVIVTPRIGRLSMQWHRLRMVMDQGAGRVQRRQGTTEGDFYGLREWRADDSRSWIHWRTSAKRQTLMVRQFEQQRNHNICLILDLWQPDEPRPEHLDNVELAVSFAASVIADTCHRGGGTVWLTISGSESPIRGPASSALLQESLQSLALAEAHAADLLPETLARSFDEVRQGTRIAVISTRPVDFSDTERFVDVWSDQRRRSMLGRVMVIDSSHQELFQYFDLE